MNGRGCDRVEAGKNVAGEDRERKLLIARAEKVTAGELVVFIERVIDFGDQTVDVV